MVFYKKLKILSFLSFVLFVTKRNLLFGISEMFSAHVSNLRSGIKIC
jgi:hypothetical protein